MTEKQAMIRVYEAMTSCGAIKSATAYVSITRIVRLTRARPLDGRFKRQYMILKIGMPNHAERMFIKSCIKAGEPLPVRKVQLKFFKDGEMK